MEKQSYSKASRAKNGRLQAFPACYGPPIFIRKSQAGLTIIELHPSPRTLSPPHRALVMVPNLQQDLSINLSGGFDGSTPFYSEQAYPSPCFSIFFQWPIGFGPPPRTLPSLIPPPRIAGESGTFEEMN